MPRPQRLPDSPQTARQSYRPNDWQDLRSELADLLERVENSFTPRASGALREEPEDRAGRNRDALRSVRRAVDRANERSASQEALQDAIREIRIRQSAPQAQMQPPVRIPGPAPLDELMRAVGGIGDRIERLEGELRSRQKEKSDTSEIAGQVAALARVVDMLSSSVGETGQIQRLEAQVASLATAMAETPRIDLSGLGDRLTEMSATVEKLADLQMGQAERESKGTRESAGLKKGMAAIEDSVRHVYDRIDAIEKNFTLSPADLEKLTGEMAAFTQALREDTGEGQQALVAMVERLGTRMGEIETRGPDIAGLKGDIGTLRSAVLSGMEPRFAAIESRIDELGELMTGPLHVGMPDMGGIEAELRRLAERMDDTGEQLADLAQLYAAPAREPAPLPDFADLIERTALRTSELVSRALPEPAPIETTAPDTDMMLDELERRMTRLFKSASKERAPDAFASVEDGIRRVGERLDRIEASLARPESNMASLARPQENLASLAHAQENPASPALQQATALSAAERADSSLKPAAMSVAEAVRAEKTRGRKKDTFSPADDIMPVNPSNERPLLDHSFGEAPDMGPVRDALEGWNASGKPSPSEAAPRGYEPERANRPPRPQSSFDTDSAAEVTTVAVPVPSAPMPPEEPSVATRNTFIEAARRAAQRHPNQKVVADSNSLIGRALSRFQASATEAKPEKDAQAPPAATVVEETADAPARPEKPARVSRFRKASKKSDEAAPQIADVEKVARRLEAGEDKPSFLMRHRQVILLVAALVAISFLTLNLISQRMGDGASVSPETTSPPPAASVTEAPADLPPAPVDAPIGDQGLVLDETPRVIDMVDQLATAAIDRTAAAFAPTAAEPPLPPALDAAGMLAAGLVAPEGVGPEEMRAAATAGDARAQFEVAAILTEGKVVPEDLAAAARWYRQSAEQGFAPSQYRLGNLYESGKGIEKDALKAREWYERAAEAGNRMSMHNLAALHAGGALGKQDFAQAAGWFEKAALLGMTDSQFNLGMLYARGLGVEQNLEASYKWFSLAAMRGDTDAGKARDDIARSLDAEAVTRLNAEIAAFQPLEINLVANFAPIGTWSRNFNPGDRITTRDVVSSVQAALSRLGFEVGVPDGMAGPRTADAIRAFEKATGMSEKGEINPRLLAVLGSQPI